MEAGGVNKMIRKVRHIYLLFSLVPTLYIISVVVHIFVTPNPSGFTSPAELFANYFLNYFAQTVRLIVNYLLHLFICLLGYTAFSRQLLLGKQRILAMLCSSICAAVLLHPLVYGFESLYLLYNVTGISISGSGLFWLSIQPQFLLAVCTSLVLLAFHRKLRTAPGNTA